MEKIPFFVGSVPKQTEDLVHQTKFEKNAVCSFSAHRSFSVLLMLRPFSSPFLFLVSVLSQFIDHLIINYILMSKKASIGSVLRALLLQHIFTKLIKLQFTCLWYEKHKVRMKIYLLLSIPLRTLL